MKTYVSAIAMMLCVIMINVKASNVVDKSKLSVTTECGCCKDCKDEKCKELCKKWSNMSEEAQKSEEGKKVKEECTKLCAEHKDCTSSKKKKKANCESKEAKDCCKKK